MLHRNIEKILLVYRIMTSNTPIEYSGGDVYFRNKQARLSFGNIGYADRKRNDSY